MDPEVDIIEFRVPVENNKTLFVWDIQPSFTEAFIYERLWSVFSSFGPLYLLKVCPNAAVAHPGFYALVKFYSAVQASKAQRSTDKRTLFQSTPVKVRLSTKQNPTYANSHNIQPLSHARCQELANHCLGFNGWCTRILTLKELSGDSEDDQSRSQEEKTLRYGCLVELSFPQYGATSRGVAVVEETFNNTGPEICGQKRCKLQRWVRDKAVVQAFSTVLVIMLGNGKVLIELREDRDQLQPEDNPEGEIQVNEVSWSDLNPQQEEEEDWELTVS